MLLYISDSSFFFFSFFLALNLSISTLGILNCKSSQNSSNLSCGDMLIVLYMLKIDKERYDYLIFNSLFAQN